MGPPTTAAVVPYAVVPQAAIGRVDRSSGVARSAGMASPSGACAAQRGLLLWQIADLLGQLAYSRLFWGIQEPEAYGVWIDARIWADSR